MVECLKSSTGNLMTGPASMIAGEECGVEMVQSLLKSPRQTIVFNVSSHKMRRLNRSSVHTSSRPFQKSTGATTTAATMTR